MAAKRGSGRALAAVGTTAFGAGLLLGALWPTRHSVYVTAPPTKGPAHPSSFADVVQVASPGVVTVRARIPQRSNMGAPSPRDGTDLATSSVAEGRRSGSGFVVHSRGLVVTSRHVVADALSIDVIVRRQETRAAVVVGEDAATDLALLRLLDPPPDLVALPIGNSEDLRAGDWIVAVGNPFGFSQTVTAGVVSFVGRHLPRSDLGVTADFLQISAPVNPGSSGCPVLDLDGRVVGVTTQAAEAAQGISFAVPSRSLRWALDAMQREPDGRVRRGYLGVEFSSRQGLDESGLPCEGAIITRVAEGEPGDRAGLRRGDIVLRMDGEPVVDARVLHDRIVRSNPGTRVAFQLLRDGKLQAPVDAVLGEVGSPRTPTQAN